jgi:hypothetical protein
MKVLVLSAVVLDSDEDMLHCPPAAGSQGLTHPYRSALLPYPPPHPTPPRRQRLNVIFVDLTIFLLLPYVYMSLYTADKQYYVADLSARWGRCMLCVPGSKLPQPLLAACSLTDCDNAACCAAGLAASPGRITMQSGQCTRHRQLR